MINQQSSSQIQSSQVEICKQELIREILKIKYQEEQINNRALRSLQVFLPGSRKQMPHLFPATKQQIAAKDFLVLNQEEQNLKRCYSMFEIMGNIQNVIEQRIEKDYNQPLGVIFYSNQKYLRIVNYRNSQPQSRKQPKKSNGSSSTSKNSYSNQHRKKKLLSQVETNEESSLMLQKIDHDLSKMIQEFYRHSRNNSTSLTFNLNSKFLEKSTRKQKQFKKMLKNVDISKIQPNYIPEYYDTNQIKSVLEYYGLKEVKTKKTSRSKKKVTVRVKSKQKEASIFMVSKQSHNSRQFERQRTQFSQINSPSQIRPEQHYLSPMTPTPRYLQQKKQAQRQLSQNSKMHNRWREKTISTKLKKSRDSTKSKKLLTSKNLGQNRARVK